MAKHKTAQPSKQRSPKKKPAAGPLVDAALEAHWKDAFTRFEDAKRGEVERWDAQYEALAEILDADPPLFLAGGFSNEKAFLADALPGVDVRTARRSCRVATYFDAKDETQHGVMKLEALLDYLEATHGVPLSPAKISTRKQQVSVKAGKAARKVPFAEATLATLRASIRIARKTTTPAKTSPAAKAVRAALTKAGLREVGVSVRQNQLTLSGIPIGRVAAAARALLGAGV